MRPGDLADPLLRQVMPLAAELAERPGFGPDPLAEHSAFKAPGLLQKYQGRALLIATGACAINCRYCFRREFPYSEQIGSAALSQAVAAIAADPGIEEVILSGGDPLSLSDSRLRVITELLAPIPHLRRLRVHTRLPVVLPSRVDAGLLKWLGDLPWPVAMVLHVNHGNEIDASVSAACAALRLAGTTLLNQAVLLRGVNDSVAALADLSQRLFEAGVVPYYLHLLDRVRGARALRSARSNRTAADRQFGRNALGVPGAAPGSRSAGRSGKNSGRATVSALENVRPVARGPPGARC